MNLFDDKEWQAEFMRGDFRRKMALIEEAFLRLLNIDKGQAQALFDAVELSFERKGDLVDYNGTFSRSCFYLLQIAAEVSVVQRPDTLIVHWRPRLMELRPKGRVRITQADLSLNWSDELSAVLQDIRDSFPLVAAWQEESFIHAPFGAALRN